MYRILGIHPELIDAITAADVIPLTQARANLSELADQVKAGAEKIITKHGESYVALIDSDRLDYYHRLERERIHLFLLEEIEQGLADVAASTTQARTGWYRPSTCCRSSTIGRSLSIWKASGVPIDLSCTSLDSPNERC